MLSASSTPQIMPSVSLKILPKVEGSAEARGGGGGSGCVRVVVIGALVAASPGWPPDPAPRSDANASGAPSGRDGVGAGRESTRGRIRRSLIGPELTGPLVREARGADCAEADEDAWDAAPVAVGCGERPNPEGADCPPT